MPSSSPVESLRKTPAKFTIHEEQHSPGPTIQTSASSTNLKRASSTSRYDTPSTVALVTSKMSNLTYQPTLASDTDSSSVKKQMIVKSPSSSDEDTPCQIDKLLSSLGEADTKILPHTTGATKPSNITATNSETRSSPSTTQSQSASNVVRDANQQNNVTSDVGTPESEHTETSNEQESEIQQLKKELAAAKGRIAALDVELTQQRIVQDSFDSVLRSPSHTPFDVTNVTRPCHQFSYQDHTTEVFSKPSGTVSPQPAIRTHDSLADECQIPFPQLNSPFGPSNAATKNGWNPPMPSAWSNFDSRSHSGMRSQGLPLEPQPLRPTNLRLESFENNNLYRTQPINSGFDGTYRRQPGPIHRPDSATSFCNSFSFPGNNIPPTALQFSPPMTPLPLSGMMGPPSMHFNQRPIGTPLSPTASEFSTRPPSTVNSFSMNHWAGPAGCSDSASTYVAPSEPMNYRRLLDKNTSCDWKYIVDKIVCSNDQQASIFLQQKLKNAPADQKYEMIDSIIGHSYPLMINRFGNFLIQRCLEHGTEEQVEAIAGAICGNVLNLSMDAFGCHVVQKALDVVPETIKASMVNELLHRIPDTVIHRYACHVWQKLFELRWTGSPPQIMKRVNEALRGMWHEVALGETGSLVVQNIFENCLEEDKRPCINEVLASIDIVAHGQFGNWCIQHICEHGLPADKSRAIEHVLRFASEYSTDQFASKVVEKCLKVAGPEFMDRYLERVCEGRQGRPRMPLIDIAGDQYGNYLIQFILIHAGPHHRDLVSNHVRKHMVSLRGSKFGSRVAMLCSNPAFSTRPGPPVGVPMGNRFMHQPPMGPGGGRPPFGPSYR